MKKLLIVLLFFLFAPSAFAEDKYKTYNKLPCKFNGVELKTSAIPYEDKKKKKNRCIKYKKKAGYKGKIGTSIHSIIDSPNPNITMFAITNMTLFQARNWSSKYRCIIQNESQVNKSGKQNKKYLNTKVFFPKTGKIENCATPFDNIELVFIDDKYGNFIRYYHLKSTPLVPGFNIGECSERQFQLSLQNNYNGRNSGISLPENCGGLKFKKVKKGEVIGKMGFAGSAHVSLGIGLHDTKPDENGITRLYSIAPEDNFVWENFPTDSDAYLFPVMSKEYLKKIGYE